MSKPCLSSHPTPTVSQLLLPLYFTPKRRHRDLTSSDLILTGICKLNPLILAILFFKKVLKLYGKVKEAVVRIWRKWKLDLMSYQWKYQIADQYTHSRLLRLRNGENELHLPVAHSKGTEHTYCLSHSEYSITNSSYFSLLPLKCIFKN